MQELFNLAKVLRGTRAGMRANLRKVLTVEEGSLETVMRYATRQKEHHKEHAILDVYERIHEEE